MKPSEVLIVNPMAPTYAWVRTDLEGKKKKFKTWHEFVRWFDPKHHGEMNMPPNTQEKFIDVLVDTLTDSPRHRRIEAAGQKKTEKKEKASGVAGSISVEVGGIRYGTLVTAFKKLGLPMGDRKTVRKEVIAKKTFVYSGHTFKLLEE